MAGAQTHLGAEPAFEMMACAEQLIQRRPSYTAVTLLVDDICFAVVRHKMLYILGGTAKWDGSV